MKPRIVLSGVNLIEAGGLAVFKDALKELALHFAGHYEITALVHSRSLFRDLEDLPIHFLQFPAAKSTWLRRLRFEYFTCRRLSRELNAHLWLSMHDITPSVTANIRAVYCHNPAPFYRLTWREATLDRTFAAFNLFYRFLYRINIHRNDFIIVQQQWLREEFQRLYPVRKVIVAHPSLPGFASDVTPSANKSGSTIFLYPAFPRTFKNIELLLTAAALLEERKISGVEIWLTLKGNENPYAAGLFQRFQHLTSVRWLGPQSRDRVEQLYAETDCLVFPSRLESWGMPLSEFKRTGKTILAADLPYAHETIGTYDHAHFIDPLDPQPLCNAMQALHRGDLPLQPTQAAAIPAPFAENWRELFALLLNE